MRKILLIITVLISFIVFANGQGSIVNQLGGNSTTDTYDITDLDGNILFRVTGEGKVGIGRTTPFYKLDVFGTTQTVGFKMYPGTNGWVLTSDENGVGTWQALPLLSETDPQVGAIMSNSIPKWNGSALVTGTIYDLGSKIGIGIATPDEKLHIGGNMRLNGAFEDKDGNAGTAGQLLSSTVAGTDWINPPSGADNLGNHTATQDLDMTGFDVNLNNGYLSGDGDAEGVFVDSDGNVGIGTAIPGAKLEVAGQVKITGGSPGTNKILTSDAVGLATWQDPAVVTETDPVYSIAPASNITNAGSGLVTTGTERTNWNTAFGWDDHSSQGYITATSTETLTNKSGSNSMWTNDEGYLTSISETDPEVGANTTNYAPKWDGSALVASTSIYEDGTGNVGIGTTGPSAKLEVVGQVKIVDGTQGTNKVLTSDANGLANWQSPTTTSDGDWDGAGSGQMYTTNSSDNVGIGISTPAHKLHVQQDGTELAFHANQNGTGGAADIAIHNSGNSSTTLTVSTDGTGTAGDFHISNLTSTIHALTASTNGLGPAGYFHITNANNGDCAIQGATDGTGQGGLFNIWNSNNTNSALRAETNGLGRAGSFSVDNTSNSDASLYAETNGSYAAIEGIYDGSSGNAGRFRVINNGNDEAALYAETNGGYAAVEGVYDGNSGNAGRFRAINSGNNEPALYTQTQGTGNAGNFNIINSSNGWAALFAKTTGTGNSGRFQIDNSSNSAVALYAYTNGDGPAIVGNTWGNSIAAAFNIQDTGNTEPALVAESKHTDGFAVHVKDVLRLEPRNAAPTNPAEGDLYVNSSDHHIYCYLNSGWKQLDN